MTVSVTERYNMLLKQLLDEGICIESKSSKWYWKTLNVLLLIVSFGQIREFMTAFTTTIGNKIGTPLGWDHYSDLQRYEVLMHESVHVRQYQKYGFGNAWVGLVPVGLAYLLLPLPVGLAYCRARLEQAGYEASIRAQLQTRPFTEVLAARDFYVEQFTSANYLWMWPFRSQMESWFDKTVRRIALEEGVELV